MTDFGNKVAGDEWQMISNVVAGSEFYLAPKGTAKSITVYIRAGSTSNRVKCAIYVKEDMSLVGVTEEKTGLSSEPSWVTFNFSEPYPELISGKTYILVAFADRTADGKIVELAYTDGADGYSQNVTYPNFPNVYNPTPYNDRSHSIYCSYEAVYPSEYDIVSQKLKSFRQTVFNDLVGGRVKARLDAEHETMQRYKSVVQNLEVVPLLFGRVMDKALQLQLKGLNVGAGALLKVKGFYTGSKKAYPYKEPFKVPQRELPQVDVYLYQVFMDLDKLKTLGVGSLQQFIMVQCEKDTFLEQPNAENVYYDYYVMWAQYKVTGRFELIDVDKTYPDLKYVEGEYTRFSRDLHFGEPPQFARYELFLFTDAHYESDTEVVGISNVMAWIAKKLNGTPDVIISIAGHNTPISYYGVWCEVVSPAMVQTTRWDKVARNIMAIESELTWYNSFKLEKVVTPEGAGSIEFIPEMPEYQSWKAIQALAHPASGYVFDHWELDNVFYSTDNPCTIQCNAPYTVKAVFKSV